MGYFDPRTGRYYKTKAHCERNEPAHPKRALQQQAFELRRRAADFRRAQATLQQKKHVRKHFPAEPSPDLLAEQEWAATVLVLAAELIEQAVFKRL